MNIKYTLASLLVILLPVIPAFCQPARWAAEALEMPMSRSIYDGYAYNTGSASDNFGNLYVAGNYEQCRIYFGSVMLPGDSISSNAFVVKYDSSGNVKWAIGSQGGSPDNPRVATDLNGNIILAGAFMGEPLSFGSSTIPYNRHGFTNYFLAKFDSLGHVLWTQGGRGMGFSGQGYYDVKTDPYGNIFLLGTFGTRTITFGAYTLTNASPTYAEILLGDTSYYTDVFLAKFDPNGNVLWARSAGGTNEDMSGALAVDVMGNAYITGGFLSSSMYGFPLYDPPRYGSIFVAKYSSDGDLKWANSIGCRGNGGVASIVADVYGNAYVTGSFDSSIYLDTVLTSASHYHGSGFLCKFDTNGNKSWIKIVGDTTPVSCLDLAYGQLTHHLYLSGSFNKPYDLTLDSITLTQLDTNSWGGSTSFIAEYGDNGIAQCFVDVDLPNGGANVNLDPVENIYMSGTFVNQLNIAPYYHFSTGINNSVFAAAFRNCEAVPVTNAVKPLQTGKDISVYPNPATGVFTVSYGCSVDANSRMEIFNLDGRLLMKKTLLNNATEVLVNDLMPGMYLCKITLNGTQLVRKVVVE